MNWKRSLIAAVITLPVLALFLWGLSRGDPSVIPSPLPGREAPEFTLEVMEPVSEAGIDFMVDNGDETPRVVSLSDHRGEVVVLNFWASWCLACRDEHRPLSEVAEEYRDRGVVFYGILYNDKPEPARRWIREMGGQSYPTLLDPGTRTAIDYGLYGAPETFFIDREGKVFYKQIGPVTRSLLREKLDQILAADMEGV